MRYRYGTHIVGTVGGGRVMIQACRHVVSLISKSFPADRYSTPPIALEDTGPLQAARI